MRTRSRIEVRSTRMRSRLRNDEKAYVSASIRKIREGNKRSQRGAARHAASPTPRGRGLAPSLAVVVKGELLRMGAQAHGIELGGGLVLDPGVDHVGREDVAAEQELVVLAQGLEGLAEAPRHLGHF